MARLSPLNLAENAWADGREDGQNFGLEVVLKEKKAFHASLLFWRGLQWGVSARPVALL